MNPLKSAAVIIGGLVAIAGSVVAVLMGSDVLTPEAKGVVGLVAGIILAVLGGAQVIVRQLQGEDPEHPAEPLRWAGGKGNGAAAVALALGAALALSACAGGQLHPDAAPYVEPLVLACPAECAAVADDCGEWASDLDGERAKWGGLLCVVWTAACPGLCAEAGEHVGGNP